MAERTGSGVPPPVADDVRTVAGIGVSGTVDGRRVEVGRVLPDHLDAELAGPVAGWHDRGETVVVVLEDATVLGVLAVSTPLRPEARPAVDHLRAMGLPATILSGDSGPAVRAAAAALGIDDARSTLSPADKVAALGGFRAAGERVLMVGDGINDAPALAAAESAAPSGAGPRPRWPTATSPSSATTSRGCPPPSAWRGRPTPSSSRTSGGPWDTTWPRSPSPRSGSSTRWSPPWPWGCRACWWCSTASV